MIKATIITEKNVLVSGIPEDKFKMEMMFPQIHRETPKTPEGTSVSLTVYYS